MGAAHQRFVGVATDFLGQGYRALQGGQLRVSLALSVVGAVAIVAIIAFLGVALVAGFLLGGPGSGTRSVLGLGTAQRNLSAALIVAAQNFSDDPDVLVFIILAGILGLGALMVAGGELGKRAERTDG